MAGPKHTNKHNRKAKQKHNRWAAFSDKELKCLWPVNNETPEIEDQLTREIEAELSSRQKKDK